MRPDGTPMLQFVLAQILDKGPATFELTASPA
jgi:hypothetical protein